MTTITKFSLPDCNPNCRHSVSITSQPIDILEAYSFVESPKCGAIQLFSGTIRNTDLDLEFPVPVKADQATGVGSGPQMQQQQQQQQQQQHVTSIKGIHYDIYEQMLLKQVSTMIDQAGPPPEARIYIQFRLGFVPVGESSIVICVSSESRQFSHDCIMRLLNEIKSKAVIWKKIVYEDGRQLWSNDLKSEAYWISGDSSLRMGH